MQRNCQCQSKQAVNNLALTSLFVAIAYIAVFLFEIPLLPGADFLKYDAKDVFFILAACLLNPMYSLLMCFAVPFLQLITISKSGIIGFIMNFLGCVSFVMPVAIAVNKKRNLKQLIIGLVIGIISLNITMQLWNYIFTPLFMPAMTRTKMIPFMLRFVLPFNLLKGTINSILALSLYLTMWPILQKSSLTHNFTVLESDTNSRKLAISLILLFLALTAILLLLEQYKLI